MPVRIVIPANNIAPETAPTPYEILGLYPYCSPEAIPEAYNRIARHLQKTAGSDTEEGQAILAVLDHAYSQIKTPERRFAYDLVNSQAPDKNKIIQAQLSQLKSLEKKYEKVKFKYDQERKRTTPRPQYFQNSPASSHFVTLSSMFAGLFATLWVLAGIVGLIILFAML